MITDSAGTIKEDEDYYPWGGELQFVNNDSNHYKIGGHERDNETGLDYMLARYYSNPLGRFLTPDWAGHPTEVPYANFGNPQSLNLYTYGKNNPTTLGDPDGHDAWTWVEVVVTFSKSVLDTTAAENRKSFANFMTPAPPHTLSTPSPCPSPCTQNQNNPNNDSKQNNNNNSQQSSTNNQSGQGSKPLHRPKLRKNTRQAVEANAPRTPDGKPIDPNTHEPIEGKPDFGHKPGNENWRETKQAEGEGLSQQEFNDRMNNSDKYQLEDPSSNRSHQYEQPREQPNKKPPE